MSLLLLDEPTPASPQPAEQEVRIDPRILAQIITRRFKVAEARKLLPQIKPFAFLSSYRISTRGGKLVGISTYNVTEASCKGHFDPLRGYPSIFPRVLMEEAAAQAGTVLIRSLPDYGGMLPIFSGDFSGNFDGEPVAPGDRLRIRVRLEKLAVDKRPIGEAHADIYLGKKRIGWTKFGFTLVSTKAFDRLLRRAKRTKRAT